MASLDSNTPFPNEDRRSDLKPQSISKKSSVRLIFSGNSFVPSDETEVGKTLLHHLRGRTETQPYPIIFSKPYNVELTRQNGSLIFTKPIAVCGFIIGPNPSGESTVLELLSDKREKIRLPMLVVWEEGSVWRVPDSRLGWNKVVLNAIKDEKNGSKIVSFKQPGLFLVIANDGDSDVLRLPQQIEKVRIMPGGFIKEALTADGESLKPRPVELDLSSSSPPTAKAEQFEDYTLAPLTSLPAEQGPSMESYSEVLLPQSADLHKESTRAVRSFTPREIRDSRMEISLSRLVQRGFKGSSKSDKGTFVAVLKDAAEYIKQQKKEPLTHSFKQIVLGGTDSSKTKLIVGLVERWQRHHQERNLFTETFWTQYYEDLATIAPLLLHLSGDIARFSESEQIRKKGR